MRSELVRLLLALCILFVIIGIVVVVSVTVTPKTHALGFYRPVIFNRPIIWLLWLQGWDKAPFIAREVLASWQFHNPNYNVMPIAESDLKALRVPTPDPTMSPRAKSGWIRLALLHMYGGVWADATILCLKNFTKLLDEAFKTSSFWMYHGRAEDGGASWLMAANGKHTPLIKRWWSLAQDFCHKKDNINVYNNNHLLWIDKLFERERLINKKFAAEWKRVKSANCKLRGQAEMLTGRVLKPADKSTVVLLAKKLCHAVKLSQGLTPLNPNATILNGHEALRISFGRKPIIGNFQLVIVRYKESLDWLKNFLRNDEAGKRIDSVLVYQKEPVQPLPEYFSLSHPNVGRVDYSVLRHIVDFYDNLAPITVFASASMDLPHKFPGFRQAILKINSNIGVIGSLGNTTTLKKSLPFEPNFELTYYKGISKINNEVDFKLVRASPLPLSKWYTHHTGLPLSNAIKYGESIHMCFAVTREAIRRRPHNLYKRLLSTVSIAKNPEACHFMERSLFSVFSK